MFNRVMGALYTIDATTTDEAPEYKTTDYGKETHQHTYIVYVTPIV
jgi:hypothetical protein